MEAQGYQTSNSSRSLAINLNCMNCGQAFDLSKNTPYKLLCSHTGIQNSKQYIIVCKACLRTCHKEKQDFICKHDSQIVTVPQLRMLQKNIDVISKLRERKSSTPNVSNVFPLKLRQESMRMLFQEQQNQEIMRANSSYQSESVSPFFEVQKMSQVKMDFKSQAKLQGYIMNEEEKYSQKQVTESHSRMKFDQTNTTPTNMHNSVRANMNISENNRIDEVVEEESKSSIQNNRSGEYNNQLAPHLKFAKQKGNNQSARNIKSREKLLANLDQKQQQKEDHYYLVASSRNGIAYNQMINQEILQDNIRQDDNLTSNIHNNFDQQQQEDEEEDKDFFQLDDGSQNIHNLVDFKENDTISNRSTSKNNNMQIRMKEGHDRDLSNKNKINMSNQLDQFPKELDFDSRLDSEAMIQIPQQSENNYNQSTESINHQMSVDQFMLMNSIGNVTANTHLASEFQSQALQRMIDWVVVNENQRVPLNNQLQSEGNNNTINTSHHEYEHRSSIGGMGGGLTTVKTLPVQKLQQFQQEKLLQQQFAEFQQIINYQLMKNKEGNSRNITNNRNSYSNSNGLNRLSNQLILDPITAITEIVDHKSSNTNFETIASQNPHNHYQSQPFPNSQNSKQNPKNQQRMAEKYQQQQQEKQDEEQQQQQKYQSELVFQDKIHEIEIQASKIDMSQDLDMTTNNKLSETMIRKKKGKKKNMKKVQSYGQIGRLSSQYGSRASSALSSSENNHQSIEDQQQLQQLQVLEMSPPIAKESEKQRLIKKQTLTLNKIQDGSPVFNESGLTAQKPQIPNFGSSQTQSSLLPDIVNSPNFQNNNTKHDFLTENEIAAFEIKQIIKKAQIRCKSQLKIQKEIKTLTENQLSSLNRQRNEEFQRLHAYFAELHKDIDNREAKLCQEFNDQIMNIESSLMKDLQIQNDVAVVGNVELAYLINQKNLEKDKNQELNEQQYFVQTELGKSDIITPAFQLDLMREKQKISMLGKLMTSSATEEGEEEEIKSVIENKHQPPNLEFQRPKTGLTNIEENNENKQLQQEIQKQMSIRKSLKSQQELRKPTKCFRDISTQTIEEQSQPQPQPQLQHESQPQPTPQKTLLEKLKTRSLSIAKRPSQISNQSNIDEIQQRACNVHWFKWDSFNVYRFEPEQLNWNLRADVKNTSKFLFFSSVVHLPNEQGCFIIGGSDNENNYSKRVQFFCKYNIFVEKPPMINKRAFFPSIFAKLDNSIYVLGGSDSNSTDLNKCEKFSLVENVWRPIEPMNLSRNGTAAVMIDPYRLIFVFGGNNHKLGSLNKIEKYEIDFDKWSTISLKLKTPIHDLQAFYLEKERVLIFGGHTNTQPSKEIQLLDLSFECFKSKNRRSDLQMKEGGKSYFPPFYNPQNGKLQIFFGYCDEQPYIEDIQLSDLINDNSQKQNFEQDLRLKQAQTKNERRTQSQHKSLRNESNMILDV